MLAKKSVGITTNSNMVAQQYFLEINSLFPNPMDRRFQNFSKIMSDSWIFKVSKFEKTRKFLWTVKIFYGLLKYLWTVKVQFTPIKFTQKEHNKRWDLPISIFAKGRSLSRVSRRLSGIVLAATFFWIWFWPSLR